MTTFPPSRLHLVILGDKKGESLELKIPGNVQASDLLELLTVAVNLAGYSIPAGSRLELLKDGEFVMTEQEYETLLHQDGPPAEEASSIPPPHLIN